jgi:hypothetical protein
MGNEVSLPTKIRFRIITDKNEAIRLLNNAEKEDFYLEECFDDKANSLARRNLTYSPNTTSSKDENYANAYLKNNISALPIRLLNELDEIKIIQLMPTADGGMPHTRPGSIICYPNFSQIFSTTTLIHELWHIHQRIYKDIWFKAFKRLGWTLWNGQLPEQLENNRRINPDTIDCPLWIFQNEWVSVPIFNDITRPNVNQVEIWFYNPNKQYHIKTVPPELSSYFPNLPPSAYEHPRELTAYLLSEPEKYEDSNGYKKLLDEIGHISIMKKENN